MVLVLHFYSYEMLPMLYYSLKHVESPLGISSTQTPLFYKLGNKLKNQFTIRIVNSQAKPFRRINSRSSTVSKKWNVIWCNNHSLFVDWHCLLQVYFGKSLIYKTVTIGRVPLKWCDLFHLLYSVAVDSISLGWSF